jgi:heme exporter protein D
MLAVQCLPRKLRPLIIIIIASSTETAGALRFPVYVWLAFVLMLVILVILRQKLFSLQESLPNKSFCLRMMKNRQHKHKGKPHRQENLSALHFSWRVRLRIHYSPVKLRPHVYVLKEPAEFHAKKAAGYHQEGGEFHQVPARGLYTLRGLFRAKIV